MKNTPKTGVFQYFGVQSNSTFRYNSAERMAQEYDFFQPRSGVGGVDGFLRTSGQLPRQPSFRLRGKPAQTPQTPQAPSTVRRSERQWAAPHQPAPPPLEPAQPADTPEEPILVAPVAPAQTPVMDPALPTPDNHGSSPAPEAPKKPSAPHRKRGKTIATIVGVLLLAVVLFFGGKFAYNIAKLTGSKNPFAFLGALQRAPLKNDNGRVNVLVAGNSADDAGHGGANLTDSIMVLSMDTRKKTAMMLSVPRDMWVSVPGHGHSKINAAYTYGGMNTLKQVIEDNLDIPVHYTALVNYTAFKDLVNAVGGITITIESPDKRGIYDPSLDWTSRNCCALAKYPNGPATLNGQQALNLARARGDAYGAYGYPQADFTRTEYQRKMLLAIFDKTVNTKNPIKLTNVVDAVANNVTTDVQTKELQSMYSYAKEISLTSIDSYNINTLAGPDKLLLRNYTTSDGQSALIPSAGLDDYSAIAEQIQKVFLATLVTKEAARVVVLNAADTAGLAKQESAKLTALGVDVVAQGNATVQPTTTIVDMSAGKKPATLAELTQKYTATVKDDAVLRTGYPNADFIVVLGQSAVPQPATTTTKTSGQ